MKSTRRPKASFKVLTLRHDARERLRVLLPELVASIVATTCMVIIIAEVNSFISFIAIAITQVLLQGSLYAFTYLVNDSEGTISWWFKPFIATCVLYGVVIPLYAGLPDTGGSLGEAALFSFTFGFFLFYLTRTRPTFVMFLFEAFAMTELIDEIAAGQVGLLVAHLGFVSAIMALYVMRGSVTRITMDYDEPDDAPAVTEAQAGLWGRAGVHAQVTVLTAAICAICLVATFAGGVLLDRRPEVGEDPTTTTTEVTQGQPQEVDLEQPQGEPQATGEGTDAAQGPDAASSDAGSGLLISTLLAVLLLAALVLPVPIRLLLRRWARHAIEREPRAADRVARLYRAIVSRLEAAGIARDEAQTPREFVAAYADDLVELTAEAGITHDDWIALTAVHEKARYAELDPTGPELASCWKLYDVLPACTRAKLGWFSYLTGAFWRM